MNYFLILLWDPLLLLLKKHKLPGISPADVREIPKKLTSNLSANGSRAVPKAVRWFLKFRAM